MPSAAILLCTAAEALSTFQLTQIASSD